MERIVVVLQRHLSGLDADGLDSLDVHVDGGAVSGSARSHEGVAWSYGGELAIGIDLDHAGVIATPAHRDVWMRDAVAEAFGSAPQPQPFAATLENHLVGLDLDVIDLGATEEGGT